LLGLLVGEVVSELDFYVGQPEQGDRPDGRDMRNAGHLDFNGNADIAFDLFRRLARRLRDDFHQRRDGIGISLDVEIRKADKARCKQQ
jgi:hypothetical protein